MAAWIGLKTARSKWPSASSGTPWTEYQAATGPISPTTNSTSHNAELQDATFPAAYFTAPGTSRLISQRLLPTGGEGGEETRRSTQQDPTDMSRQEHQQRAEALEQQQQMKILEWQNRMKVLAWEQELVRERRKAARQEEKAFRMKKAYYKAKLKRMGEDVPPSSSSSSDEEENTSNQTGWTDSISCISYQRLFHYWMLLCICHETVATFIHVLRTVSCFKWAVLTQILLWFFWDKLN